MSKNRVDQILDYAEREIRKNGFDGVSFRDIASAIGIKSASVHYHFPTKADLGAEVTKRYSTAFISSLGEPDCPTENTAIRLSRLSDAYINAYRTETSTCLCAVLGSVVTHLPENTSREVSNFYSLLSAWLSKAISKGYTKITPNLAISLLQGAMVLSITTGSDTPLLEAKQHILALSS